jgi:hypothetical protein
MDIMFIKIPFKINAYLAVKNALRVMVGIIINVHHVPQDI